MHDGWPLRLEGDCLVTWSDDASPKSGTCKLVRVPTEKLAYSGELELCDWDDRETVSALLRLHDVEMEVFATRLGAHEGHPLHAKLFVSSCVVRRGSHQHDSPPLREGTRRRSKAEALKASWKGNQTLDHGLRWKADLLA